VKSRADAEALDRDDPLSGFRDQFVVDERGPIYLDGNSLGRLARPVRAAYEAALDDWQDRLVGGWPDWIDLPRRVGDRLGHLIGAGPGQVAVSDSTTVNLYKLAVAAMGLRPGRSVIVADAQEFPTDRYVLAGVAEAHGGRLVLLESDPVAGVDAALLADAVDEQTALVCLSQVNYRSAARLDVAALTEVAHRAGALVLWDLCHSVGAVPVDLDGAGVDLAVGCTYKYLNGGPGSPAFVYVRSDLLAKLRQPIWGWFGQADQFAMGPVYQPAPGVERLLAGTPPILALRGVEAAVELVLEARMERIWAKSQALTALMVDLVRERLEPAGAFLASPADPGRRGGHVSVGHPAAWPWCSALIEGGLVVPDFRPPDVIRLGPAPLYTRFTEVFDAVERMAGVLEAGLAPAGAERPRVT
jgi:kynureninase